MMETSSGHNIDDRQDLDPKYIYQDVDEIKPGWYQLHDADTAISLGSS